MSNTDVIITIFGDICPVKDTLPGFISEDPKAILSSDILSLISKSDITVGNLECSLTDNPTPIQKTGPVLHAPTVSAQTLSKAGVSVLSLANNHIRDCGTPGVESTIAACKSAGIAVFGAGNTKEEANRPYIIKTKGLRIAFVSFAEHEFNAIRQDGGGAAIFDIYDDFKRLQNIRSSVDYMIVLYHGGIEYHPYPSPMLQKKCRMMADAGADLVLCQHSHCIGSYEKLGNSTILYGQGNNLFGYRKNNHKWNEGLIVQIHLSSQSHIVELIPGRTNSDSIFEIIQDERKCRLLAEIDNRSEQICADDFIKNAWEDFCKKNEKIHLPLLLGWNKYFIFLNKKLAGWPLRLLCNQRKRNIIHNLIRCESHYEVLRTILSQSDYK